MLHKKCYFHECKCGLKNLYYQIVLKIAMQTQVKYLTISVRIELELQSGEQNWSVLGNHPLLVSMATTYTVLSFYLIQDAGKANVYNTTVKIVVMLQLTAEETLYGFHELVHTRSSPKFKKTTRGSCINRKTKNHALFIKKNVQLEWVYYLQNSGLSFAVVIFIYKGRKQK